MAKEQRNIFVTFYKEDRKSMNQMQTGHNSKLSKALRKLGFKRIGIAQDYDANADNLLITYTAWEEPKVMNGRKLIIQHFSNMKPEIHIPIGSLPENYMDVYNDTAQIASHMEES